MFSGNGYIPTSSLREILRELDEQLTDEELDGLIQEIDTDGSGTVDFDGKYNFITIEIKLKIIYRKVVELPW